MSHLKFASILVAVSVAAVAAVAAPNPCNSFAQELEPQIHQELVRQQVENLDREISAIKWQTTDTSDGKVIIIRQSYIAAKDGTIENEIMATAECDASTKTYQLLRVTATQPVVDLKLAH